MKAGLGGSEKKRAVLKAISDLSQVFIEEKEDKKKYSFNCIAKALQFYDTWHDELSEGSEKTIDRVFDNLNSNQKKQFFDQAVKYLREQVPLIKELEEKVCILRALPYLLKILRSCM